MAVLGRWKTAYAMLILALLCLAGDPLAHVIEAKWTRDTESVVLEIQNENSKATTDASPCTLRSLLHEFEEQGMVDVGLLGHRCGRPDVEDGSGDLDWYRFWCKLALRRRLLLDSAGVACDVLLHAWPQSEPQVHLPGFWLHEGGRAYCATSRICPRKVLDASPVLKRHWRVAYSKAQKETGLKLVLEHVVLKHSVIRF